MLNTNLRAIFRNSSIIWHVVLLAMLTANLALADGMVVAPEYYELYEAGQLAFLEYDAATATEQLTIMPKLRGDARDFAWVVPVPSLPELSPADAQLFRDLRTMSTPIYRDRGDGWNCGESYDVAYTAGDANGVEIISEAAVGAFHTMTLSASEASDLVDSLTTWGFLHDGNVDAAGAAIAHYVDMDWYFVTMKVDSTAYPQPPWDNYYQPDAIDPIRFTFTSSEPVYPLRISAVSAYNDSHVYLYTKADHRLSFLGAETEYANRITAGELAEIAAHYPAVGAVLGEGDFLTKLVRRYTPAEMTDDLVLVRHQNDEEFLPLRYGYGYGAFPLSSVLLPGSGIVWFWWRRKRHVRRRGGPDSG